jgi:uncharacterized protein YfbU (UPF0304 family)
LIIDAGEVTVVDIICSSFGSVFSFIICIEEKRQVDYGGVVHEHVSRRKRFISFISIEDRVYILERKPMMINIWHMFPHSFHINRKEMR